MAAAVNQTIVYSITEGNEGGEYPQSCLYVSVVDLADFTAWLGLLITQLVNLCEDIMDRDYQPLRNLS